MLPPYRGTHTPRTLVGWPGAAPSPKLRGHGMPTPRAAMNVEHTVTIINCGGTINMSGSCGARPDDMVARSLAPVLQAQPVPVQVQLRSPFPRPPDSSNLNEAAWDTIRDTLRDEIAWRHQALEDRGLSRGAGVVLTHGTDTMALTSLLVSLDMAVEKLRFPIIFTGAHATPDQPGSDAIPNLTKAIALAGPRHRKLLPPGVFVVIGHDLHLASRLTKVETSPDPHGRYFFSYPAPIGQVSDSGATLKLNADFLEALRSDPPPEPLVRAGPLGHVEHLIVDRFTDPRVLTDTERRLAATRPHRRTGLVVQGNFAESPHWPALAASLGRLHAAETVVAVGSRIVYEKLTAAVSLAGVCLIPRSLSHPAARLKLAWLLGTGRSREGLGTDLETNLVGEVFETESLPEWIAYETYPDRLPGTEVVVVRPDLRRTAIDDAVARLLNAPGSRRDLHLYGFGHGHIPGPNASMANLVAEHLRNTPLHTSLEGAPDVWAVLQRLVAHIACLDRAALLGWVHHQYTLLPGGLRQAILAARARQRREHLQTQLEGHLLRALQAFEAESGVQLRDRRALLDATLQQARWRNPRAPAPADLQDLSPPALLATLVELDPTPLARRLIKDAVMAASPLHAAVGAATDRGIRVHPRTQVTRGQPDPTRYEAGTLLMAVGAGGSGAQARRWQLRIFAPRPPSEL